ncbi:restriction endonuclease [Sporomusa termitida]|uniref:Restriction endonuclease n=1 Tax=Sporomusa termitida TaxID=2377 RepID=A0A517DWU0_9FIRM|nr:restriction endonuclease [Sporomusa termitida]QDR81812.1 Restriction endonuclease [Sporomusa termitida]
MQEEADAEFNHNDFIQQAKSMVEDAIGHLDPWEMQDLVAGILRAMGYQVRVSPKGPDGGVDILAHKDAFGFEKPVVKVQVKHRKDTSSAPEIQQLLGASPMGGSCIFVATGGFKSTAVKVAQQNDVKLIDLPGLADLLTDWYESLPNETKALIPMKKVYVPFK